jgi:hypothetical protein
MTKKEQEKKKIEDTMKALLPSAPKVEESTTQPK